MKPALYLTSQAQAIDHAAARYLGIDSFELMQQAALAVFQHIKNDRKVLVVTGPGNNGGDGWVVAELARQNGQHVTLWAVTPQDRLQGDAQKAASQNQADVVTTPPADCDFDVIVDGIFGSGLNKNITGPLAQAIDWINQQSTRVVAIDIPSGLHGDTGQVMGVAVRAKKTVSILTHHPGSFTAAGKDHVGLPVLESLQVPIDQYSHIKPCAHLLDENQLSDLLTQRCHDCHKGRMGHVWVAGGQKGMSGAALLAAHAVLRVGAGAVTTVTNPEHAVWVPLHLPEIMSHGFDHQHISWPNKSPDVLAIGMGMGQNEWGQSLMNHLMEWKVPKVLDADALGLVSKDDLSTHDVITPHPLEAARMCQTDVKTIQENRYEAVRHLADLCGCVVVLKGSGSLICDGQNTFVCPHGSDALATAGSGDVLAGMIAGLMAQGHEALAAAQLAVLWHAITGEKSKDRFCLTASGILQQLPLHLPA